VEISSGRNEIRINRSKIEYKEYEFDKRKHIDEMRSGMIVEGDEVKKVENFKY